MADANEEFLHLADAIGCGVASMPDAKGLFKYVIFIICTIVTISS